MRSAAQVFINMFATKELLIRPAKLEGILVALLHTISKHDLLEEAIQDIDTLTDVHLENRDGIDYVKAVTHSAEMVGLFNKDKSLQLILKLLPTIAITERYGTATLQSSEITAIIKRRNKSHIYAELKKALKYINDLNLGYKIIQTPRNTAFNVFHIIKYKDTADMLSILQEHGLQTPSVLDKVI